jgi:hypothetical protein
VPNYPLKENFKQKTKTQTKKKVKKKGKKKKRKKGKEKSNIPYPLLPHQLQLYQQLYLKQTISICAFTVNFFFYKLPFEILWLLSSILKFVF